MIQYWENSLLNCLVVWNLWKTSLSLRALESLSLWPLGMHGTRQHQRRARQSLQTHLKPLWFLNVNLKASPEPAPWEAIHEMGWQKGPALLDEAANVLIFSVLCDLASKQLSSPLPVALLRGWPLGTVRGAHSVSSAETTWSITGLTAGRRNLTMWALNVYTITNIIVISYYWASL